MAIARWRAGFALRDFVELVLVLGFVVVVPPLVEQQLAQRGISMTGTNRIVATAVLFVLWAAFAGLMLAINREPLKAVGLARPRSVGQTVLLGLIVAAIIFVVVVTLEHFGYGRDRLGDMGRELRGNWTLLAERVAISLLIVGFVEEFIFR